MGCSLLHQYFWFKTVQDIRNAVQSDIDLVPSLVYLVYQVCVVVYWIKEEGNQNKCEVANPQRLTVHFET